jgi:hypothetical protein
MEERLEIRLSFQLRILKASGDRGFGGGSVRESERDHGEEERGKDLHGYSLGGRATGKGPASEVYAQSVPGRFNKRTE